jgi:hypothetical protein
VTRARVSWRLKTEKFTDDDFSLEIPPAAQQRSKRKGGLPEKYRKQRLNIYS